MTTPAATTAPEPPYRELECVVLARDVPEAGLRAGDVGTVVWVYGAEAVEEEPGAGQRAAGEDGDEEAGGRRPGGEAGGESGALQ